jgi:hypothetical protein
MSKYKQTIEDWLTGELIKMLVLSDPEAWEIIELIKKDEKNKELSSAPWHKPMSDYPIVFRGSLLLAAERVVREWWEDRGFPIDWFNAMWYTEKVIAARKATAAKLTGDQDDEAGASAEGDAEPSPELD